MRQHQHGEEQKSMEAPEEASEGAGTHVTVSKTS